jgi:predicted anti-sigma-YlaC factor YlaD
MRAEDPHELVRCNEVMNIIDIGVMMVKAALEPEQYERGVWFLGRQVSGETQFRKTPIVIKYPSRGGA